MQQQQQPTLRNVHIRSAEDAHKVFYAVQLGKLSKIERRLDANERAALSPGDVYVWEKKGPTGDAFSVGMERFTEGKSWTASRVRDEFLMYFENVKKPKGRGSSNGQRAKSSENHIVRPGEHDQFIKQTYSVYRNDPDDMSLDGADNAKEPRKWHLNAYFTKLTEGQLRTIDDIPELRDLDVPEGTFRSARTSKVGKKEAPKPSASTTKRTFAPFPSNYRSYPTPYPVAEHDPEPGPSNITDTQQVSSWLSSPTDEQSRYSIPYVGLPPPQQYSNSTLPPISQAVPFPGTVCLIPDPDDCAQGPSLPDAIQSFTPAPIPPNMAFAFEPSYEYISASAASGHSNNGSDYSMSPSFSEHSGSWRSAVSPMSSSSSSFSAVSSPMMPSVEFPLMDNGMPYQPAPSIDNSQGPAGPSRVDLAPLRSLRSHPYRRCPADDRALRLLGPGARG